MQVAGTSPFSQPGAQGLAPRGSLPHPSSLSSLCLSYGVQSPGGSLIFPSGSSSAAVKLKRSGGGCALRV